MKKDELVIDEAKTKDVFNRAQGIIAHQLGVEIERVVWEAHFANDLEADSLDTVELVMALEQEFSIQISDINSESTPTVGEVIEYLVSKVS